MVPETTGYCLSGRATLLWLNPSALQIVFKSAAFANGSTGGNKCRASLFRLNAKGSKVSQP